MINYSNRTYQIVNNQLKKSTCGGGNVAGDTAWLVEQIGNDSAAEVASDDGGPLFFPQPTWLVRATFLRSSSHNRYSESAAEVAGDDGGPEEETATERPTVA
ncbi:unnamed protein product [Linum trigynum]|uniref:Uncharacterized protein n=1 Tax=Linum trigynum TaxID=586398 RepID=A0AAV2DDR8_9ROSI